MIRLTALYLRSGQTGKAISYARRGLTHHQEQAGTEEYIQLGNLLAAGYLTDGSLSNAEFVLKQILEWDPENVVANNNFIQLKTLKNDAVNN